MQLQSVTSGLSRSGHVLNSKQRIEICTFVKKLLEYFGSLRFCTPRVREAQSPKGRRSPLPQG